MKSPKQMEVRFTNPQIAAMRVRPAKGQKKRPIVWMRPSRRKIQAELRGLLRQTKSLRGQLRRTAVGESEKQSLINSQLGLIQRRRDEIMAYWKGLGDA